MSNTIWKFARWLLGIGLLIVGAQKVPEPSSTIEQRWREVIPWTWLEANWVALACFSLAAILFAYSPLKWWIDRQNAKNVRLKIRSNLTPGAFHETDAFQVLRYLLKESVWGWRQYARLNSWEMVSGLELTEFERAGREDEIIVTGYGSVETRTVVIERRLWISLRIDAASARVPNSVVAKIPARAFYSSIEFSDLAVATADIEQVWPRASIPRRWWSLTWVWLRRRVWYGSKIKNWLEKRRRAKKTPGP